MKIYINDGNPRTMEMSMEEMYNLLAHGSDIDTRSNPIELERLICWLPSVKKLKVCLSYDNNFVDVIFSNSEEIRLYNVGIEYAISDIE